MVVQNELMQIVDRIPVNQNAPATYPMKRFLLEKMKIIFNNRSTIIRAAESKRKQNVLDAYKKSVGFEKKAKAVMEARQKLKKVEKELMEVGLSIEGNLLSMSDSEDRYSGVLKVQVNWDGSWVDVGKETLEKVKKVKELLNAVEKSVETYTEFDRLETRMVMASTVGEVMALLNAAVGEPVFKVKTLALEETTQEKGNNQ